MRLTGEYAIVLIGEKKTRALEQMVIMMNIQAYASKLCYLSSVSRGFPTANESPAGKKEPCQLASTMKSIGSKSS
jgi:hypothetical protein